VDRAAFEPANMVPGIGPSPDKVLLGRLFAYPDAHRYRIGTNYLQLPVNRPRSAVNSYNRDGSMRYSNPADPVYAPNSFGGPVAGNAFTEPGWAVDGEIMRAAYTKRRDDDDFGQAGTLYREVMDAVARERLVTNISNHLKAGVRGDVLKHALEYWHLVDNDLGTRVARSLGAAEGAPLALAL
jgi:catalase